MSYFLIALDPANCTGITCGFLDKSKHHTFNINVKPKDKTKTRPGEPDHIRPAKLFSALNHLRNRAEYLDENVKIIIAVESTDGKFFAGKAAAKVASELRGAIFSFIGLYKAGLYSMSPADLKRFATGKGQIDKTEMVSAARRMGYDGYHEDEADSYLIWEMAAQHIEAAIFISPNQYKTIDELLSRII
jgi:hypothetical protein